MTIVGDTVYPYPGSVISISFINPRFSVERLVIIATAVAVFPTPGGE